MHLLDSEKAKNNFYYDFMNFKSYQPEEKFKKKSMDIKSELRYRINIMIP